MDEPTAWEDINPKMALAPQAEQRLPSLAPATSDQFRNELTACLALVVPVGMTEEARREWLLVAWETLKHLPPDILHHGCEAARKTADHPSKIVPAIIAATDDWMKSRRSCVQPVEQVCLPLPKKHIMDRDRRTFQESDWAELNEYLERMGSVVRYRPDGTRFGDTADAQA
jgi:hypothetical protein